MSWLDTLEQIRTRDFAAATPAERDRATRDVVNMCSYACAVVSISPLPFSDAVLMLPIQSAMVMTVGHVYGRRLDQAQAKDLILELAAVAGASFLARQGIKALLPVIGALLTVPAAFAANWAMGRVAMEYFKDPELTSEQLREVYARAKEEGGARFSKTAFDEFRKQREGEKKEAAAAPKEEQAPDEPRKVPKSKTIGRAARPRSGPATPKAKAAAKTIGRQKISQAAVAPTAQSLVEVELPRRVKAKPDVAAQIGGVVHLDLSGPGGGQWTLNLMKPDDCVARGLVGQPRVTVRSDGELFVRLVERKADPQTAIFTGKLALEPMDVELANSIARLFA